MWQLWVGCTNRRLWDKSFREFVEAELRDRGQCPGWKDDALYVGIERRRYWTEHLGALILDTQGLQASIPQRAWKPRASAGCVSGSLQLQSVITICDRGGAKKWWCGVRQQQMLLQRLWQGMGSIMGEHSGLYAMIANCICKIWNKTGTACSSGSQNTNGTMIQKRNQKKFHWSCNKFLWSQIPARFDCSPITDGLRLVMLGWYR